jgi:hypothetical protein
VPCLPLGGGALFRRCLSNAPPFTEGDGSLEICPRCLYQPGYDDVVFASGRDLSPQDWRERWVAQGMPWESTILAPPDGWDPRLQLRNVERS